MVVGICRLELHVPGCRSLKEKRKALRRVIERTRARFNAAVAEVGAQDLHQRGVVGIAVVGGATAQVQSALDKVTAFIEDLMVAQLVGREVEILHLPEGERLDRQPLGGW